MHRRRFLQPERYAGAVAPLLVPTTEPTVTSADDYALLRVSRRAMATTFEVAIPYGTPDALDAATDALDLIDELEDQLTVYRDHSEVSRLNATAAAGPVVVEEKLFDLFSFCARLTAETAGAFDCAAGALTKAWGFYRREGRVPTPAERAEAMARTGMRHVILDPAARTVKFRKAGLEFNLGGVGKGYALDRAAELLRRKWGISSALLHGGSSSVVAVGHPPGDRTGWPVAIRHPSNEARTLGVVRLRDQALGTSAATFQFFVYNGHKLGHLIDPRTGWPAAGTASASVVAPTGAEADAISTAFFVLGAGPAAAYCQPRPHLGAVILPEGDGTEPQVVGFPPGAYSPPGTRETFLNVLLYPD
jgi:thiamine biosynthesis lipoprotein